MSNIKSTIELIKIRNEIKDILDPIEKKEKELDKLNQINMNETNRYKKYLEDIITEYHNVCKKLYS